MKRGEWQAVRREKELRQAIAIAVALPYQPRAYWLRKLDAEGHDAIPAFSSWLARGENDVPAA
jgi:hypothetical protein